MIIYANITEMDLAEVVKLKDELKNKKNYGAYLKTEYWKKLSLVVKNRAEHKCQVCNSRIMLCAHHRSYANACDPEKEIDDLVCLCAYCHSLFHSKEVKITYLKPDFKLKKHNPKKKRKSKGK